MRKKVVKWLFTLASTSETKAKKPKKKQTENETIRTYATSQSFVIVFQSDEKQKRKTSIITCEKSHNDNVQSEFSWIKCLIEEIASGHDGHIKRSYR